jgi:basic membrane lipoprotein Med (substrate-binding protein (PBP1-ABC) superfamily)
LAPAVRPATARCKKSQRRRARALIVFCIGVDTDQWETLPAAHPCLVSSAMKLITPSVVDLINTYAPMAR